MNEVWLYILIILASFVIGFLIARYTKEELTSGKIWFMWIFILGIILGIIFLLLGSIAKSLTFFSLAIIAGISWISIGVVEFKKIRSFQNLWLK